MSVTVKAEITAWLVGSQVKITLPEGSVLELVEKTDTAEVQLPPEFCGQVVRVTPEVQQVLIDTNKYNRAKRFKESIAKCLHKITHEFDALPRLESGSLFHVLRDLGPLSDWVASNEEAKHWLHHMNLAIPHPSLSVEQATMPDKSKHLVLMLTHTW